MQALNVINIVFAVLFVMCYAFQMAYLVIPFIIKAKKYPDAAPHKFAILIAAKDEEAVIGDLIESIGEQNYPAECVSIFVIADNCTDSTARIARELGAYVYERENKDEIGKGYVLDFALKNIDADFGEDAFDAFVVFDADNLLDKNFLSEVNKTFSAGYDVVTCYRNAKNYGESWLSAGSGLWFIRDSRYLNGSRMRIGACPQVSGTGFLFSNSVKKENGGWPFHTLTEDYEFTCASVVAGKRFGYCESAIFYDEQTPSFSQSFNQRLRWCKGGIQSFVKHWRGLLRSLFSKKIVAAYDMLMSVAPAYIISIAVTVVNLIFSVVLIALGEDPVSVVMPLVRMLIGAYLILLLHSAVPTFSEWRRINAKWYKKILYMFTFPLYMITFIPACFVALFKKNVKWKKIDHGKKES